MTEINIILNTDFQDTNNKILKNDKELFYETINNEFNIYKFNNYSKYIIPYNQIINDFLFNDNYLDYEIELQNINSNIKKFIIKKIFIFFNPIIKNIIKINKNIIDKDSIYLSYPIDSKSNTNIRLKKNQYFLLNGIYNKNKYNNNLPYNLDEYKFIKNKIIELLKSGTEIKDNIEIYNINLNYKNHAIFNYNNIELNTLKELYLLYLNYQFLYFNNVHLITNNIKFTNTVLKNDLKINITKSKIELVEINYNNNYIKYFNTFLRYKINNIYNNHSYYAFQSSGLLELYERILINSIDDINVKNQIINLKQTEDNLKKYYKNKQIIDEYNLKYIEIEYLTRKKFPNLFNLNSKEVIFNKFKPFNIDELQKKYKDVILIEYKKLQMLKMQKIKNNCKHKLLIKNLSIDKDKFTIIKNIKSIIQQNNQTDINEYYKCVLCSYNLICPHILEYYEMLFSKDKFNNNHDFSIRQHIINKYMTSAKINMIYYCKICGEELGRSLDLEQNIEYKDKIKLNTMEYTDTTLEIIKNNTINIIYSYVTFTALNINISKQYLINYIVNAISNHINLIEKSLRKSKIYNEEQIINILDFNSIIFIYATIIYIMTQYSFLSFTSKINNKKKSTNVIDAGKNIIIPKKIEVKSNKDLLNLIKLRFKEAYDLIISTNNILLYKLKYQNQNEKIKELLVKTYSIVAKNDQLTLSDQNTKINNSKLLINSSIFNYFSLIHNIELSYNNKKESNFNSMFEHLDILYSYNPKNINILDLNSINKILNLKDINSNKNENIFSHFNSSIIDTQLFNRPLDTIKITSYNQYKILSFNLFYYHIYNELYNISIYNYISTNSEQSNDILSIKSNKFINDNFYLDTVLDIQNTDIYNKYIQMTHILKRYEIELINKNIKHNLYPISFIKLNSIRYFYNNSNELNLNKYFCLTNGKQHNFNIYVYNATDNKNNVIEFNKKDLDANIENIVKLQFIDYKCSNCKQFKSKIINDDSIKKIINDNNDKDGFFNLYINICPISLNKNTNKKEEYQYHQFNYNNTDILNLECSICKIKYNDLINKNIEVYNKFYKEYINYKNKKNNIINYKLFDLNTSNSKLYNTNIINIYKNKIQNINTLLNNRNSNIFDYINSIDFDTLLVTVAKKFNIDIIYLQKIGLTEGHSYIDIKLINDNYGNLRIYKLQSYFRTILIYYNLLKYDTTLKYNTDLKFNEIINNLYTNNSNIKTNINKFLPDVNYNMSELINTLKLDYDNKQISHFLIKIILQFILDLNSINENHFNNKLFPFIQFILIKIINFDELFTNYNYSQLKQMFTEDKFPINTDNNYDDNINYENDDDEDDLFAYNDLNIQFEDEDQLDE
jgi:hypothetical protein